MTNQYDIIKQHTNLTKYQLHNQTSLKKTKKILLLPNHPSSLSNQTLTSITPKKKNQNQIKKKNEILK